MHPTVSKDGSMSMAMTCRDFIRFLDDFEAGNLAPAVRAAFDAHLGQCRHCRDYLETYRRTIALSRGAFRDESGAVPTEVPGELVEAILAARRGGIAR
jgi:anti-sigma factor RsiW